MGIVHFSWELEHFVSSITVDFIITMHKRPGKSVDDCIAQQRGKNARFVVIKYRLRKADAWEGGLGAFIESYPREQSVVSRVWPVLDMGLFVV